MNEPADNPQGSPTHDPWEMIGESEAPPPADDAPRDTGFRPVPEDGPVPIDQPPVSDIDLNDNQPVAEIAGPIPADCESTESEDSEPPASPPPADSQRCDDPDISSEVQTAKARLIASSGAGWTIPILCAGLCLIACCVLIPQADANRRLAYEKRVLEMDLASIKQQVALNDVFLKSVGDDPTLAERLAQRQMKIIRAGTRVLPMKDSPAASDMSPFQLVSIAPPAPLPPYRPVGGVIAGLCYNAHTRLYLTGAGLLMVAVGLVLGTVRW